MTPQSERRVVRCLGAAELTASDLRLLAAEIEARHAERMGPIRAWTRRPQFRDYEGQDDARMHLNICDSITSKDAKLLRDIAKRMERAAKKKSCLLTIAAPDWWSEKTAPPWQVVAVILGRHGVGIEGDGYEEAHARLQQEKTE